MANNSFDPAGNMYTYDAGVNNAERANSSTGLGLEFFGDPSVLTNSYSPQPGNADSNWFPVDSLLNDDDLFGAFIHSSPKVHSIASSKKFHKSPSGATGEFLGSTVDRNIDPSLQGQSTNLPRNCGPACAAESAGQHYGDQNTWNLPPIGHFFWMTFPFQEFMTAANIQLNTAAAVPMQAPMEVVPVGGTFPNFEPFNSPFAIHGGGFGIPQAQGMPQYGQSDYSSKVPGYGTALDNGSLLDGNPMLNNFQGTLPQLNPFQFPFQQPTFDQLPHGSNTDVCNWIPSPVNLLGHGGDVGGFQTALVNDNATKSNTVWDGRRQSDEPGTWDYGSSDPDSPDLRTMAKPKYAGTNAKAECSRTIAQATAVAKAQETYEPRRKPGPLTIHDPQSKKTIRFKYTRSGELDGEFSVRELKAYIMHQFWAGYKKGAKMLIQCVPADSNNRYPVKGVSDKCRFRNCVATNRTIAQGTFRVALDEEVNVSRFDPFHVAGFVHLYCLERFIDLGEIAQKCTIMPDTRKLNPKVEGTHDPSKLHLNRTSENNVKTATDFLNALASGQKHASGFGGQPYDYSKTLCWKLTRNATIDAKPLRHENAGKRAGVNMFVHFNDEQRKIGFLAKKKEMKDNALFDAEMVEVMKATIKDAKMEARLENGLSSGGLSSPETSSSLAKRREERRRAKERRNRAAESLESAIRRNSRLGRISFTEGESRSPRLNQTASTAHPAPIQTAHGRKRSRQLSEADAAGDEEHSPKALRPVKKPKLNQQPSTPKAAAHQRKPTLDVYDPAAFDLPSKPPPPTPKSKPQWGLAMPETPMTIHSGGQSSPLSPPPRTPVVLSPKVSTTQGRKRSRQQSSDGSL